MSKSAQRRARRLNAFVEVVDRRELWSRHNGVCGICRGQVKYEEMTIDHRVPLSKGGLHSYANTQPAHEECNVAKGNSMPEDYVATSPINHKLGYLNRPALALSR